ncbi:conserved Plasmodium protein, unknown function [Plasmodium sp. DRC-Itaito]|nr:conserved Plasmodium protein, unknown function [Plasmodium sp. DRC-Itaito]
MLSIQHNVFDKLRCINKLTCCYCYNIIYKKNYTSGGEYSSNISRIFYHINEKLKNVTEQLRKNEKSNQKEKEKNNKIKVNIINKPECYKKNESVNHAKVDEQISYPSDSLEMDIIYECSKEKKLIDIYKQYDKIICKINYDQMLGRDLSYCMNILSKIKYFKDNIFWHKASNKLIKGYMIHKINIHSYYIIANALSNAHLLYETKYKNIHYQHHKQVFNKDIKSETICNNKILKNNLQYHKLQYQNIKNETLSPFRYISFDDNIILKNGESNISNYHNIYDQIAYRFIIDIQNMNLDNISCTINLFSKMNLLIYNFLGYYFADYFVLYLINNNKNNDKNYISPNISSSTILSYFINKNKCVDISPNKCNISKLVIILHSLIKSNVIHLEFFYICLEYFNKYFIHLNNIDMCNILYCFSRCQLVIRSNHTINKLCMRKRIMDKSFQNFVNNIIKKLYIYNQYYSTDQINNMENMYNGYYDYFGRLKNNLLSSKNNLPSSKNNLPSSKNNLLSLSSLTDAFFCINNYGKVDKLKCWNVLNKIINHIEKNEKILNNFTSLQISSIILSVCKLKISSLNIFYALNYRVHYLWRYFSLRSIADYLYAINERNIYDEQICILLFYQFIKIIMWKYLQYMGNKFCIDPINNGIFKNKLKQNNQGIIYHLLSNVENNNNNNDNNNNTMVKKKRKKKLHLLNESDISMCVRIFQSFSKFDIIKNINMFLYYYNIYFPYDISTICINYDKLLNKKKMLMCDNFNMDILLKSNTSDDDIEIKTTNQDVHICCDNNENHNYNIFKSDNHFNSYNKEGQNIYHNFLSYKKSEQEDDKNFWMNLNIYPKKSFLFFHSYKKYIDIIKLYTLRTFFFLIFQHYHIITFDQKCLLCYFMLSVPHLLYPFGLYNKNNLLKNKYDIKYMNKDTSNNHIYNNMENIFPFKLYFKKKLKRFNIYIPPSAYILFDILYNMELNTLNEITIRQIYTCLLCLHLNIIKFCYYIRSYNNNNKNNNNDNNNNNNLLLHKKIIFHLLSLNMLKKINSFLDHVNQNRTQQNEINLSSRTHNEVYNYLKSLIGSSMFYKKGKKINQKSEFIVGPFVLDCVIEFL